MSNRIVQSLFIDRQRFDIRMSPELTEQLETISTETGMMRAEVFHRAIALYKCAKEVERRGGNVLLLEPDGTTREITRL